MALINFVVSTENSQLVLFAERVLGATDSQVALLFAAGAAGVVVVSVSAAAIRRRLSFTVTALGALIALSFGFSAVRHGDRYLAEASASTPGAGEPAAAQT